MWLVLHYPEIWKSPSCQLRTGVHAINPEGLIHYVHLYFGKSFKTKKNVSSVWEISGCIVGYSHWMKPHLELVQVECLNEKESLKDLRYWYLIKDCISCAAFLPILY